MVRLAPSPEVKLIVCELINKSAACIALNLCEESPSEIPLSTDGIILDVKLPLRRAATLLSP